MKRIIVIAAFTLLLAACGGGSQHSGGPSTSSPPTSSPPPTSSDPAGPYRADVAAYNNGNKSLGAAWSYLGQTYCAVGAFAGSPGQTLIEVAVSTGSYYQFVYKNGRLTQGHQGSDYTTDFPADWQTVSGVNCSMAADGTISIN